MTDLSDLTEAERRELAMCARYRSSEYDDFRYWRDLTVEQRKELKERWRNIADRLHTDPWGTGA